MANELTKTEIWEKVFNAVSPDIPEIKRDLADFLRSRGVIKLFLYSRGARKFFLSANKKKELSELWADEQVKKYTLVGATTALPSLIPGLGTLAQIGTEAASIGADLSLMLRYMYTMVVGIGLINGRDMESSSNRDLLKLLGIWCGILRPIGEAVGRLSTKAAIVAFNKYVPGKLFQKINKKIGTTILTKWGTKRGGIAIGRLLPFLIGPAVGASFNYLTMSGFKKVALDFFSCDEVIMEE